MISKFSRSDVRDILINEFLFETDYSLSSLAFAEYILMKPSDEYALFMDAVVEKIYMSKVRVSQFCF